MLTVDLERLGLCEGERVLDMGCGGGRHALACLKAGSRVVALDPDESELRTVVATAAAMGAAGEVPGGADLVALRASAGGLPFCDESFDRVIAAEVLEHIPDDALAMAELFRVLRVSGTMAVTVPRYLPEVVSWLLSREYHETDGGHVRIYRRRELEESLARLGMTVTGRGRAHGSHTPYWWLKCLVGVSNERNLLVRAYHRLLVGAIVRPTRLSRAADRLLDPLLGKSLVVYLERVR